MKAVITNYFKDVHVCFPGVTTHCGCIFHGPVAGFSLLSFSRFVDHTQRRATVGRTPLDE